MKRFKICNLKSAIRNSSKGFTLVELAIVLIIIGILVALGAALMGPLTKRAKYNDTKEIINADVESVTSFAAANNRLPCEANDNSGNVCGPPGNKGDEFTPTVRNPNDAWTKPLYYIYDNNLTDPSIGGVCGRKTTNITVRICPDATCATPTNTINNVAFIILSGSENYNNQTAGTQGVTSATTINVYDVDVVIDNYVGDMNRPEPYDDIVKWITLDELRIKTGCVGAQLKILNNELPYGFRCSAYSATISADGGVPYTAGGKYRWCTQGTPPGGITLNPNTISADCLTLAEASWGQANDLTLSAIAGALYQYGTYSLTFFVRDNNDTTGSNDNIAQKTLILTIAEAGNPIRVWNTGGSTRDYTLSGTCRNSIANNAEISDFVNNIFLRPGTTCIRHAGTAGGCTTAVSNTITYDDAISVDANCNYQINFTTVAVER